MFCLKGKYVNKYNGKMAKILSAETIDYCIKNRGGNNQEIFFVQILRKCYLVSLIIEERAT